MGHSVICKRAFCGQKSCSRKMSREEVCGTFNRRTNMEIYLNQIAHGRSGDKGDTSNVCVFAREPKYFDIIKREVTVEKVREHFGDMVKGDITRYEVDSLKGFNFVMKHALGGGATHSLRLDSLGKSMGSAFLRMKIHVEEGEL